MPKPDCFSRAIPAIILVFMSGSLSAQVTGGDLLNEAPLSPIPAEMTFEEYRDMNRRLTVGLMLAAIPVPGMIHFYAGEKKTGLVILGTAVAGLAAVVVGASGRTEGAFPDTDFDVLKIVVNPENERWFEKIPVQVVGVDTTYRLREIFREREGGVPLLMVLGIATVIGDILYDYVHGIKIIEKKRDSVRFKYGKLFSDVSLEPWLDPRSGGAGLQLSFALR